MVLGPIALHLPPGAAAPLMQTNTSLRRRHQHGSAAEIRGLVGEGLTCLQAKSSSCPGIQLMRGD